MGKLNVYTNKTLKLMNVLERKVAWGDNQEDGRICFQQMNNYIRTKGKMPIGPLIQYVNAKVDENGVTNVDVVNMIQCNDFICNVTFPYVMKPVLRITNCMYCRYIGPEDKINFAYDKIQLEAFENDIPLKGDSYTIFVNKDEENEIITADVFMERAD